MSYIYNRKASDDMNVVLVEAMKDSKISQAEAKQIIDQLNTLHAATRKQAIQLLHKHGHTEVAEHYNKLVLQKPPTKEEIEKNTQRLLDAWRKGPVSDQPSSYQRDMVLKRNSELIKEINSFIKRDSIKEEEEKRLKIKISPARKKRIIWGLIVGSASIISLLFKLGII